MKCIWCLQTDAQVEFRNNAHIVPKSLGGDLYCANVCIDCNHFFGTPTQATLSVEEAIKEAFLISRVKYLHEMNEIGPHQPMVKPKSRFFDFYLHDECTLHDHSQCRSPEVNTKESFLNTDSFHKSLGRTVKRGLYKMYLECVSASGIDACNSKFDHIRAFSFADDNEFDLPVFYFIRRHNLIILNNDWPRHPRILVGSQRPFTYLTESSAFSEFDFMGHTFGIATTNTWHQTMQQYINALPKNKSELFRGFLLVESFDDIDLQMHVLDSDRRPYESWIQHRRTKQMFG